jgi:hypothetical protein
MSSDPGESHSSAHNDHGDEMEIVEGAEDAPATQEDAFDSDARKDLGGEEEDVEELQSISSAGGTEGLTFARTRRSIPQDDTQDSASELSFRPKIERPQSPASSDIPDDTPSIQVCSPRSDGMTLFNVS